MVIQREFEPFIMTIVVLSCFCAETQAHFASERSAFVMHQHLICVNISITVRVLAAERATFFFFFIRNTASYAIAAVDVIVFLYAACPQLLSDIQALCRASMRDTNPVFISSLFTSVGLIFSLLITPRALYSCIRSFDKSQSRTTKYSHRMKYKWKCHA